MDDKPTYYSTNEVLTFILSYLKFVQTKWWKFLIIGVIGAAAGLAFYYLQKPKYEADCVFILEEKQSSIGGLGGVASQFGIDLGGMLGGGSIFSGDNVLEILKSRRIIQEVLLSKVDSNDVKNQSKLIDLYLDFSELKKHWSKKKNLADIRFSDVAPNKPLTTLEDSVLQIVYKRILKTHLSVDRVTKKGSIIKVVLNSANEVFSKLMSERIVNNAKEMYIRFKTNNASINVRNLENKADSLLTLLNRKTYQVAGSIVVDANPGLKSASVPTELNSRDKIVLQTLYGEVVKNLEISRIALNQQTPIIEILDNPTYPLEDERIKLTWALLVGIAVAIFVALLFYSTKYFLKQQPQLPVLP